MRSALRVMLLCEVLHVDLGDPRIKWARDRAIELVSDAEPACMGGFQWALTVLAIYTREPLERERLHHLICLALSLSFGNNYRGSKEILQLSWEVLDCNGAYENGIAPWREAMSAFGRNMWV